MKKHSLHRKRSRTTAVYSNACANSGKGTSWWVRIGEKQGYALDANQTISLEAGNLHFDSTNQKLQQQLSQLNLKKSIRQVRWVIRTEGFTETISGTQVRLTNAEAPRYFPVPKGLYVNADADDTTEGRQDRNDVDKYHYGLEPLAKASRKTAPMWHLPLHRMTRLSPILYTITISPA